MCFAVIAYSGFYLLSNVPFSQPAPNYNSETPVVVMNSKQAERVMANSHAVTVDATVDATEAKHLMLCMPEFHISKYIQIHQHFLRT